MILAHTEDQYPFKTIYNKELTFYKFHQGSMSNPQWSESFNTKVDVSKYTEVTLQHKLLLEYVAQEAHTLDFDSRTEDQQSAVHTDAEER